MRTWLEINRENLRHNVREIQKRIGNKKIMGIVKANSYGLGSGEIAKELVKCQVDYFAVATLCEGIELREEGIEEKILILGGLFDEELKEAEKYNLEVTVSRFEQLKFIHEKDINIRCQIAIDTGMGRVGFNLKEMEEVVNYIEKNNLTNIIGVYTHLSVADEEDEENKKYTENQIKKFNTFQKIKTIECRHVLNSGGILNFSDEETGNYVRAGILMYGICGDKWAEGFKPVITFKSKVLFIKTLTEDMYISYGRAVKMKEGSIIATVSAGYADGFKRGALNTLTVNIKGRECRVIGKICMDLFMVEIPHDMKDIIKIGDEVILYGENLPEKAKLLNVSPYEIVTGINERVKRVYLEEK